MTFLEIILVVTAVLYYQKLIRDGKIPRPNGPKGLPTRIVGLVLAAASLWLLISQISGSGGLNRSNIFILLGVGGYLAWTFKNAKRKEEKRKAGIEVKGEMKRSLIFLGFAILVAIFLLIISLPK